MTLDIQTISKRRSPRIAAKSSSEKPELDSKIPWTSRHSDTHLIYKKGSEPKWMSDNIYIHSGFRTLTNTYTGCFYSLTFIHNETANVYTHLLGSLLFISIWLYASFYQISLYETSTIYDYIIIGSFMSGCIICMGSSTIFHLFICHSRAASIAWNKLDYVGIVGIIYGCFLPIAYYGINF